MYEPMDQEYRPIFEQIYAEYSLYGPAYPYWSEESLRRLRSEIDSAAKREGLSHKLRADAKLFLLINLHEMFIRPIGMRGLSSPQRGYDDVWGIVEVDLSAILRKADAEPEITGRHILDAVSSIYRDLKMPSFEVWG